MIAAGCGAAPQVADRTGAASRAAAPGSATRTLESTSDVATDAPSRKALERAITEARAVLAKRAALLDATTATRETAHTLEILADALRDAGASLPDVLARSFRTTPAREVFVTGYHEPTLAARRKADATFRHPIYRMPAGGGPLPTRAEIEDGALAGRGLELFWTDDPVELFFLQVQGSGRLRLEDGTIVRIGYAGNNGKTYTAIGSVLVQRGVFRREEVTAPVIKAWLRANPSQADALMRTNSRYVFFSARPATGDEGPAGALGVPLVPWRSVAVDPKVTPLGSVGRLVVPLPDGSTFDALVVAMDAGTAITGPGRLDLFCGPDARGEQIAGELRHAGTVAWLRPAR
ncbi:MltA domain-containing protein [Candidatus Binatia bacterium]|nr:MltA domain-containing protein [Candidatus Binatia bacterium]